MTTATDKVLNTTELLEHILIHHDNFSTLHQAQCVNRQFRDTIEGSLALQRTLGIVSHTIRRFTFDLQLARDDFNPLLYPTNLLAFGPFERRYPLVYPFESPSGWPDDYIDAPEEYHFQHLIPPDQVTLSGLAAPPSHSVWDRGLQFKFLLRPGLTDPRLLGRDSEHRLGVTDHARTSAGTGATYPNGSERKTTICLVGEEVELSICVVVPRSIGRRKGLRGQFCYFETRSYLDGDVTFADLVRFLDDVRAKSYGELFLRWYEKERYRVAEHFGEFDDEEG